jgi:hypothetical protein
VSYAFFVVRREYVFYNESDARLLYIEKIMGLTARDEFLDPRLLRATRDGFTVEDDVRQMTPIGTYLPWKARIRTLFLLEFVILAFVSLGEILFCLVALANAIWR